MKKSVKISLRIAGILLAIGAVFVCLGLLLAKGDFSKISNLKGRERTMEVEAFTSVSVDVTVSDVKILPATDGKYTVALQESDLLFHSVTVEEGDLKITTKDTRKWYQHIGFSFIEMEVAVYLPEGEYDRIKVSADSGDIDIRACGGNTQVELDVRSGEISVKDVTCQSLFASAGSGEIEVRSVEVASMLTVKTNSGDVDIEKVHSETATVVVKSGNIRLTDTLAARESLLEAGSGNITLTACDSGSYEIRTSSGNVKGSILTPKVFLAKANSGNVRVPDTTSGGECRVKTGSGNVHLELYEE